MNATKFKAKLRSYQGAWITTTDEQVVATLECCLNEWHEYGIRKGLLWRGEKEDKYVPFYLTEKGLEIAQKLAQTTCISGRRVKSNGGF